MTEGKAEYLQMIQEPISRMSTASAIFKGFAATIVSGIAALTYCDVHPTVLALSFVPVLLFALLDIYYLKLEKKYRFCLTRFEKTNIRLISRWSLHGIINQPNHGYGIVSSLRVYGCSTQP